MPANCTNCLNMHVWIDAAVQSCSSESIWLTFHAKDVRTDRSQNYPLLLKRKELDRVFHSIFRIVLPKHNNKAPVFLREKKRIPNAKKVFPILSLWMHLNSKAEQFVYAMM